MPLTLANEYFQIVFQTSAGAIPSSAATSRLDRASRSGCELCRVSGFISRFGDSVVGILEGHRDVVLSHMELIVEDTAGRGLLVLYEASIPARRFGTWIARGVPAAPDTEHAGDGGARVGRLFANHLSRELYRSQT